MARAFESHRCDVVASDAITGVFLRAGEATVRHLARASSVHPQDNSTINAAIFVDSLN